MTLSFTPINELTFADTLASGDYLLVWDISAANLAKRLTLQALANFLVAASANIEWEGILNKPAIFPPSAHTHIKEQITDLSLDWQGITDKPATFPPAAHTHVPADILGLNQEEIGGLVVTRQLFAFSGFAVLPTNSSFSFLPIISTAWQGLFFEKLEYQTMANTFTLDETNYQGFRVGGMGLSGAQILVTPLLKINATLFDNTLEKNTTLINVANFFSNSSATINRQATISFEPFGNINGMIYFTLFYRGIL